jgi:predicted ATPase
VRPTNMGFGVSYALPIVLGALTAANGGLIIIENPEAHLHPAGQSQMGIFLARMASAGVQVIAETHSDHVLNGVRRAIGEGVLSSEDAIVHFFGEVDVDALAFTPTGGDVQLASWILGSISIRHC